MATVRRRLGSLVPRLLALGALACSGPGYPSESCTLVCTGGDPPASLNCELRAPQCRTRGNELECWYGSAAGIGEPDYRCDLADRSCSSRRSVIRCRF